jgi:hypothetical protein
MPEQDIGKQRKPFIGKGFRGIFGRRKGLNCL